MARSGHITALPAMLAVAVTLLTGCAGSAARAPLESGSVPVRATGVERSTKHTHKLSQHPGDQIAQLAQSLVGTPYRYGGDHPTEGFDCSGLVFFTHRQLKLSIPRTSRDQYRAAKPINASEARPGDLVFFSDQSKLSHVGIYLGNQRFVHAPSSGRVVSVARLDGPYYRQHLVGMGRLY